jgi:threonine dehydrogenase-like Zn-dependent dehydrogenase
LWLLTIRRSGANWRRRWVPTKCWIPRRITIREAKPAVVFEAVGVPGIINDVMRRAPMGTRLVVAGVCTEADPILPLLGIAKEINVQFVNAYNADEFAESLRAIADGEIDVAPLVTGEVGLDGFGAAFDDLASPDTHCKILVTP